MADLGLLEDTPQESPLDLLINAINGPAGQYTDFDAEDEAVGADADGEGGDPMNVVADVGVEAQGIEEGAHVEATADMEAYLANQSVDDGSGAPEGGSGGDSELETRFKRSAEEGPSTQRLAKMARTVEGFQEPSPVVGMDIGMAMRIAAVAPDAESTTSSGVGIGRPPMSTVEVWHPKTGQKSYGKERRILQPPPTLRVTGPLASQLTNVTLSALLNPDPTAGPVVFSSQTQRIANAEEALAAATTTASAGQTSSNGVGRSIGRVDKKEMREDRKRKLRDAAAKTGWGSTLPWQRTKTAPRPPEELGEGLTFAGLWVGEHTGKSKEFRLELSIGPPGVGQPLSMTPLPTSAQAADPTHTRHVQEVDTTHASELDDAALRRVLGATNMDPLLSLGEADAAAKLVGALGEHGFAEHSDDAAKLVEQVAATLEPLGESLPESLQESLVEPQSLAGALSSEVLPSEPVTEQQAVTPHETLPDTTEKPWATFTSDPLTIVSKPSQKSAKARSMAGCLSSEDAFALLVRVNAQTVRTKFMQLDNDALTARAGKWSPFRFNILQRAVAREDEDRGHRTRYKLDLDREKGVVTYGSLVQIVEVKTGATSDRFRLVRVDKNEVVVGADYGRPVSELQRIGLVRVVNGEDDLEGGGRWYLSAPGAVVGAGEVNVTRARPTKLKTESVDGQLAADTPRPGDLPATLRSLDFAAPEFTVLTSRPTRKKTKRYALAKAAITEEEQGTAATGLVWHQAQRREGDYTVTEGKVSTTRQATIETVDDWMCWVLSGVCGCTRPGTKLTTGCFSYSFFNGIGDDSVPKARLDPVPRLLVNPTMRNDTVELTLSTFFVPDNTGASQPFSVYLGPIGPLRATTWRSAAPKERYYEPGGMYPAYPYFGAVEDVNAIPEERRVMSNFPYSVPHVIASVQLPPLDDIIRAMNAARSSSPLSPAAAEPEAEHEDAGWLGVMGPTTELTIQEAIRNAGKTHEPEHDMHPLLKDDNPKEGGGNNDFIELAHLDRAIASAAPPIEVPVSSAIVMRRPAKATEGLAPLPMLLVRPDDGVGFGIGWSVVARPSDEPGAQDGSCWGLQITQTTVGQA